MVTIVPSPNGGAQGAEPEVTTIHRRFFLTATSAGVALGPWSRPVAADDLMDSGGPGAWDNVANVRRFGARGDGVHDDTAAFQSSAGTPGDVSILVPPGRYALSTVRVGSSAQLHGFGPNSVLQTNARGAAATVTCRGEQSGSDLSIDSLVVDGNRQLERFSDEAHGIDISNYSMVRIGRLEVRNCWGHGVRIRRCSNVFIESLLVHDNGKMGLCLEDVMQWTENIHIGQIIAYRNGTSPGNDGRHWSGVDVGDVAPGSHGPRRLHLGSIISYDNTNDGISIGRNAKSGHTGPVDLTFDSLQCHGNGFHGVEIYGVARLVGGTVLAYGNRRHGCYITNGDDYVSQSDKIMINAIMAHSNGQHGVFLGTATNVSLASIVAFNNSQSMRGQFDGVSIDSGTIENSSPGTTSGNFSFGSVLSFDDQKVSTQRHGLCAAGAQVPLGHNFVGYLRAFGHAKADLSISPHQMSFGHVDAENIGPGYAANPAGVMVPVTGLRVGGHWVARGRSTDSSARVLALVPVEPGFNGLVKVYASVARSSDGSPVGSLEITAHIADSPDGTYIHRSEVTFASLARAELDVRVEAPKVSRRHYAIVISGLANIDLDWHVEAATTRRLT